MPNQMTALLDEHLRSSYSLRGSRCTAGTAQASPFESRLSRCLRRRPDARGPALVTRPAGASARRSFQAGRRRARTPFASSPSTSVRQRGGHTGLRTDERALSFGGQPLREGIAEAKKDRHPGA